MLMAGNVLFKACNLSAGASSSCLGSTSLSVGWIDVVNIFKCDNIKGSVYVAIVLTFFTPFHALFKPLIMSPRPIIVKQIMHAVATNENISMANLSLLKPECPACFSHCCQAISFLKKMKVEAMMATSQIKDIALQSFSHLHMHVKW
jgi:hypothetical protein